MLDPNNKNRMDSSGRPVTVDDRRSGMGNTGIMVAVGVAAVVALGLWSFSRTNDTASSMPPATTTGMSTTSPSAPANTTSPTTGAVK